MLTISPRQLEHFDEIARERFRASLRPWLRQHSAAARRMSDEELAALIRSEQERAARYGLVTERQIGKWCALAVLTRPAFDASPVVAAALIDPANGATPEARLDRLMSATAAHAHRHPPARR